MTRKRKASDPNSSDIVYEFDVLRQSCFLTGHLSLLPPLFGKDSLRDIKAGILEVQKLWRGRVVVYHQLGWQPARDWLNVVFLRNCPPTGITQTQFVSTCKRILCPFCYVRNYVVKSYCFLENALCFGKAKPREKG